MIAEIYALLQPAGFAQVLRPDQVGQADIDAGVIVADLINSNLYGEVYNLALPTDAALPNAVFQRAGVQRDIIDGLPIIRIEKILLSIRHNSLLSLKTLTETIRTTLLNYATPGSAGAITIEDEAEDVEFIGESNSKQYRVLMELNVTHLAVPDQSLPAIFVYPLRTAPQGFQDIQATKQLITDDVALVIVDTDIEAARRKTDSIVGSLINGFPLEYGGGELLRQDGHLSTWRERVSLQSIKT